MAVLILPVNRKVEKKIRQHRLTKKIEKQIKLLQKDFSHPSLNVKLLQPKKMGIYSFRIDRKFRDLFIFREDKKAIEILNITVHYQ